MKEQIIIKYSNLALFKSLIISAIVVFVYKYWKNIPLNLVDWFQNYFLVLFLLSFAFIWLLFFTMTIEITSSKVRIYNPFLKFINFREIELDSVKGYLWYYSPKASPTLTVIPKDLGRNLTIQVLSNKSQKLIESFFLRVGIPHLDDPK